MKAGNDQSDVLVVGIAVVDAVARPVDQFPGPGGLRFFDGLTLATGGNAVSCSIALSRLGVRVDAAVRVGRDMLGDYVVSELGAAGVGVGHVVRDGARSTSFSFVAVAGNGERSFLHTTGANAALQAADVPARALAEKRVVFVTGTMLMDALDGEPTAGLMRAARSAGAKTMLDTVYVEGVSREAWRRRVLPALPEVDFFAPSEPEAASISGESDAARMAAYFREHGAGSVVIKLGSRGVVCFDEAGRATNVAAMRVPRVVDATGAGDCWGGGLHIGIVPGDGNGGRGAPRKCGGGSVDPGRGGDDGASGHETSDGAHAWTGMRRHRAGARRG